MPYNGAGGYILPVSYKAVPGTLILDTQHNGPLEDIQSALSAVLLRDGRAPMSGDLSFTTGRTVILNRDGGPNEAVRGSQLSTAVSGVAILSTLYTSVAGLAAGVISPAIQAVLVGGFADLNDRGGAQYNRLGSAPAPVRAWHVQNVNDLSWWQLTTVLPNARMFGALGNGIADDTAAIQAMIDYCAAFGLGRCRIPAGTYNVLTATLVWGSDNLIIEGDGDATVIRRTTLTAVPLFRATNRISPVLRDIALEHSATPVTSSSTISVGTGSRSYAIQTGLPFNAGDSLQAWATGGTNSQNYMIGTVTSYNTLTGALVMNMTAAVGSGSFSAWEFARFSGENAGCRFTGCTNGRMDRVTARGRFYIGLEDVNGIGDDIADCRVIGSVNRPIYPWSFSGVSEDVTVSRCYVDGQNVSQYGINLNGSTGGNIDNARISGCDVNNTMFQGIEAGGIISNSVIDDCTVDGVAAPSGAGILIQFANSAAPQQIAVKNCRVFNVVTGIDCIDSFYVDIEGCKAVTTTFGIRVRRVANGTNQFFSVANCNLQTYSNTGIALESATASGLANGRVIGNAAVGGGGATRGIFSDANTAAITFTGNQSSGNTTGNFLTGGAGHVAAGNV